MSAARPRPALLRCAGLTLPKVAADGSLEQPRQCRNLALAGERFCIKHHPDRERLRAERQAAERVRWDAHRADHEERLAAAMADWEMARNVRRVQLAAVRPLPMNAHQCRSWRLIEPEPDWGRLGSWGGVPHEAYRAVWESALPWLGLCERPLEHGGGQHWATDEDGWRWTWAD